MIDLATLDSYIKDGMFCWTLTSNGYKYMTWNLAIQWKKAGISEPLCILCADKPSYQFLQREGVSCRLLKSGTADFGPSIVPFGSRQFSVLNKLKLELLDLFARAPGIQQTLYLDGDIAVYKNIVADLRERLKEAPFWAPCDEQQHECSGVEQCPNFCTGLVAWRHGADKGCFRITDSMLWAEKPEDQVWVNGSCRRLGVDVAILPRDLYPNGARLSLTKNDSVLREKALCLHYNYRVGAAKVSDMKRFVDWHLPY